MFSYPTSDHVLDDLGDKVVEALSQSVASARADLADYRATSSRFVAESSKRGLANWIHDRLWAHGTALFEDVDAVLIDDEPVREIAIGINYKVRFKRHHADDRVSTYPTQGALDFIEQRGCQLALDGLHEVNLIAGYRWFEESFEIGPPVLSLRNELERVLWIVDLPDVAPGTHALPIPSQPGPVAPVVEAVEPSADRVDDSGLG